MDFKATSDKLAKLEKLRALRMQVMTQRGTKGPVAEVSAEDNWNKWQSSPDIVGPTDRDPYQGPRAKPGEGGWKHIENATGSVLGSLVRPVMKVEKMLGVDTGESEKFWDQYQDPAGRFAGDMVAGMAAGGVAGKAIQGASKGLQLLGKAGAATPIAGRVATGAQRVLNARPVRGAIEGGAQGATISEDTGEGTELGAKIGATLGFVPSVLRKAGEGLVKTRPEFEKARQWVESRARQSVDVPLAQRIDETGPVSKAVGGLYRSLLPYFPGAKGALRSQSEKAGEQLRRRGIQEIADRADVGDLPVGSAAPVEIEKTVGKLEKSLTNQFDETIHKYRFKVSGVLPDEVQARLSSNPVTAEVPGNHKEVVNFVKKQIERHTEDDGEMSGRALNTIKNSLWNEAGTVTDRNLAQAYREAANAIDDHVGSSLVTDKMRAHIAALDSGKPSKYRPTKSDWDNWHTMEQWKRAREGWGKLLPTKRAVASTAKAREGAYGTGNLIDAVEGQVVGSPIETEIQMGRALMPEKLTDPSTWARLAAFSKTGLGWLGTVGSFGTSIPVARGLAAEGTQKALFGELAWQKKMADAIRKYGKESVQVERLVRAKEIQESDNAP